MQSDSQSVSLVLSNELPQFYQQFQNISIRQLSQQTNNKQLYSLQIFQSRPQFLIINQLNQQKQKNKKVDFNIIQTQTMNQTSFFSINSQNNSEDQKENNTDQQNQNNTDDQKENSIQLDNKQSKNNNEKQAENKNFNKGKLSLIASLKSNTQESIYDQQDYLCQDEYSELAESQNSFNLDSQSSKSNNQLFNTLQKICKPSHTTFSDLTNINIASLNESRVNESKKRIENKKRYILSFKNKVITANDNNQNKFSKQQAPQAINFKKDKLKHNRRKSQQLMQKKRNIEDDFDGQGNLNLKEYEECRRQSMIRLNNDNIYSRYGYVNNDLSNQFTNSLILNQMDQKYITKIKKIKQNARIERDSIKKLKAKII